MVETGRSNHCAQSKGGELFNLTNGFQSLKREA
jgi:hypothetical protein